MKIFKKELTTNGDVKYRVHFVVNKEELELIVGILITAKKYFPSGTRFMQENSRLGNIVKSMNKALRNWNKL